MRTGHLICLSCQAFEFKVSKGDRTATMVPSASKLYLVYQSTSLVYDAPWGTAYPYVDQSDGRDIPLFRFSTDKQLHVVL